jgi:hypothetical protein
VESDGVVTRLYWRDIPVEDLREEQLREVEKFLRESPAVCGYVRDKGLLYIEWVRQR